MSTFEETVEELRAAREGGLDAVELALLSRDRLGTQFNVISFIASFRMAFGIPLQELQRAQAWHRFEWGDKRISDEEFRSVLDPWLDSQ
jgi:hypothetical protein